MTRLTLDWSVGETNTTLVVNEPFGAAGNNYQILIDKFLQGSLHKINDEWKAYLNSQSVLTSKDIFILGSFLEKERPQG